MWRVLRGKVSLLIALAAGAGLLAAPIGGKTPPAPLQTVSQVWPAAKHVTLTADLPDGTAYQPLLFPSTTESIGSAPSKDGKWLRLVVRPASGPVRELRRLPIEHDPSFPAITIDHGTLVWAESTTGHQELWTAPLTGGAPRRLIADIGDARFYQSQYDLLVAEGRVHWVTAAAGGTTQVRSVALTGGAVDARAEPGTWSLTTWPWLVDGVVNSAGSTTLRNLKSGRDQPVPTAGRGVTACTPVWCQIVSLTKDGTNRIELVHPDGSERRTIAGDQSATVIADVAVLDRYAVISQLTPTSELTGNVQLLIYEIGTRRTVEVSPDCFAVSYRAGVLSWSTGTQQEFLRHALDLRTV